MGWPIAGVGEIKADYGRGSRALMLKPTGVAPGCGSEHAANVSSDTDSLVNTCKSSYSSYGPGYSNLSKNGAL